MSGITCFQKSYLLVNLVLELMFFAWKISSFYVILPWQSSFGHSKLRFYKPDYIHQVTFAFPIAITVQSIFSLQNKYAENNQLFPEPLTQVMLSMAQSFCMLDVIILWQVTSASYEMKTWDLDLLRQGPIYRDFYGARNLEYSWTKVKRMPVMGQEKGCLSEWIKSVIC